MILTITGTCRDRGFFMLRVVLFRFPRRGGYYRGASNAGLGYVNGNNERGNENANYGGRSRSQHIFKASQRLRIGEHPSDGRGTFLQWSLDHWTKILYCSAKYGKKRQYWNYCEASERM